jgi:chaperonin GroES
MNMRPLYDRVVVKRVEEASRSKGGLFLPETAQEKPLEGEIVAVGHGRLDEKSGTTKPLAVRVGDRVVFGRYSGTEIKIAGEDRLVLREDEIFGVVNR